MSVFSYLDGAIMEKPSVQIIQDLVQQKLEGESYSQIRSSLSDQGFNEDEIKSIVRRVDEQVLRAEIDQGNRNKAKSWNQIGLVFAVVGLVLTIGNKAGWILMGTSRWVVYSLFFAGILLMLYGRSLQRKIFDPFAKGPGNIRKKRPYK